MAFKGPDRSSDAEKFAQALREQCKVPVPEPVPGSRRMKEAMRRKIREDMDGGDSTPPEDGPIG